MSDDWLLYFALGIVSSVLTMACIALADSERPWGPHFRAWRLQRRVDRAERRRYAEKRIKRLEAELAAVGNLEAK